MRGRGRQRCEREERESVQGNKEGIDKERERVMRVWVRRKNSRLLNEASN